MSSMNLSRLLVPAALLAAGAGLPAQSVLFSQRGADDDQMGRAVADLLEKHRLHTVFNDDDRALIHAAPFFFLATSSETSVDCSFKGGPPGFVRVTGASELAFPDYDGNRMFKSLGNVVANPHVGLLFIAMHDKPKRLGVNGIARISDGDPLADSQRDRLRVDARKWVLSRMDRSKYGDRSDINLGGQPGSPIETKTVNEDSLTPEEQKTLRELGRKLATGGSK